MYHHQTHRTAKYLTARSAMNADTKFCAPMPCQSLASRKRPPRSSWTRSIWRVISTAWVTPRYRTPAVVHVVTVVSRRANAIADLLQRERPRRPPQDTSNRQMSCGCFTSFRVVLTTSTIYWPILRKKVEYFNFRRIFDRFQKCSDDESTHSKIEAEIDFKTQIFLSGIPEYSNIYCQCIFQDTFFVYLYIYDLRAVIRKCWPLNVEGCQFNTPPGFGD